jgi:hypothetical protein
MTPGLISVFSRQQPGLSGHKSAISLHPMYVDIDTEPKVSKITLPLCYNPDTCPEELTLRDAPPRCHVVSSGKLSMVRLTNTPPICNNEYCVFKKNPISYPSCEKTRLSKEKLLARGIFICKKTEGVVIFLARQIGTM